MMNFLTRDSPSAIHSGTAVNLAVMVAWLLPVTVGLYLIFAQELFAAYAVIPCWIACGVLYLVLSKFTQKPVTEPVPA